MLRKENDADFIWREHLSVCTSLDWDFGFPFTGLLAPFLEPGGEVPDFLCAVLSSQSLEGDTRGVWTMRYCAVCFTESR